MPGCMGAQRLLQCATQTINYRVYARGNCPHGVGIFSEFCSSVLFLDNVITSFLIIYFLL